MKGLKKWLKILMTICLSTGLIVVAVVMTNLYLAKKYEARVNAIRQEFLQNKALYDDCIALAQRINTDQDFSIYYDVDLRHTVVKFDKLPVDVDSQLLDELNVKFEAMKYFRNGLDVWKDRKSMRLTESQLDGLGSGRLIDLTYYDNPPSDAHGEQLSEHWFLKQWDME